MLPPKIIIILDELESDEPAEWQWLLHAENSLTIDTLTHQLLSSVSCIVKFFSSSPSSMSIKDSFDIPLVNFRFVDEDGEGLTTFDTDQKHFTLKTDSRNSKQRILSVFSFGNDKVEETKYTESKEAIRNLHLGKLIWLLTLKKNHYLNCLIVKQVLISICLGIKPNGQLNGLRI